MTPITTYAPIPAAARPAQGRSDPFGFLRPAEPAEPAPPEPERPPTEKIKIRETGVAGMVIVTIEKPDGRSLTRQIPLESWIQDGYRESLIANMCSLLA